MRGEADALSPELDDRRSVSEKQSERRGNSSTLSTRGYRRTFPRQVRPSRRGSTPSASASLTAIVQHPRSVARSMVVATDARAHRGNRLKLHGHLVRAEDASTRFTPSTSGCPASSHREPGSPAVRGRASVASEAAKNRPSRPRSRPRRRHVIRPGVTSWLPWLSRRSSLCVGRRARPSSRRSAVNSSLAACRRRMRRVRRRARARMSARRGDTTSSSRSYLFPATLGAPRASACRGGAEPTVTEHVAAGRRVRRRRAPSRDRLRRRRSHVQSAPNANRFSADRVAMAIAPRQTRHGLPSRGDAALARGRVRVVRNAAC